MIDGQRALPVPEESRPVGGAPPTSTHCTQEPRRASGLGGVTAGAGPCCLPSGALPPSDIAPPHARPHERFFLGVCFADIWGLFYF